jgi:hypothetical protein
MASGNKPDSQNKRLSSSTQIAIRCDGRDFGDKPRLFFRPGCCKKARRTLSPIAHASNSKEYHFDEPSRSLDVGRVGGRSDGARRTAFSQAERICSSDAGTEAFTAPKNTTAGCFRTRSHSYRPVIMCLLLVTFGESCRFAPGNQLSDPVSSSDLECQLSERGVSASCAGVN